MIDDENNPVVTAPADDGIATNEPVDPVLENNTQDEVVVGDSKLPSPAEDKIRLFLETLNLEGLTDLLLIRRKLQGAAAFDVAVQTNGNYDNLLARMTNDHSTETDRVRDGLGAIKDTTLFDTKLVRDGKTILGPLRPRRASGKGMVMSGMDAKAAFAINTGKVRRVPLYNSGFSIDISQPSLESLNVFFTKAHDTASSYGRQFGAYFYYFHALMIKESVVELIRPLILNSTLKNWNRGTTLLNNIALVDLKVILNAVGGLMYPEGFNFTHICTNPIGTCTHQEETLIDVNKLTRFDFSKLPDAAIRHMARTDEVTPESLNEYHKYLGFNDQTIRHGRYGFKLKSPSLANYLDYGKIFNGELLSQVFVDNPGEMNRAIQFSFYRIYTPFIATITLFDEDDEPDVVTADPEVISSILSQIQADDKDYALTKAIDEFITNCEIGKICYPATPCPSCNYLPGSGYYTVDPEHAFFILSLAKLGQS